jgi:alkylation response protein AidB-like acyl-CoA dehydrogenase
MIDRKELRDSVANFCLKAANLQHTRSVVESDRDFDPEMWRTMAEMGWTCLLVPEEQGGLGLGIADMMVVAEELGRYALSEPLLEVAVSSVLLLSQSQDSDLRNSLLEGLIGGELIAISALESDIEVESDAGALKVSGRASRVALVNSASGYLVDGARNASPLLLWVPAGIEGLHIECVEQTDGTVSGTLCFNNVTLDENAVLCEGEQATRALSIAEEGVSAASTAYLFGLQSHLLDITLEYLRVRKQFGKTIGSFQALQHRCVDLYVQNQLTKALVDEVSQLVTEPGSLLDHRATIARARHRAVQSTAQIIKESIQLHGGIGFTVESDVSLFVNRGIRITAAYGNAKLQAARFAEYSLAETESQVDDSVQTVIADPENKGWNSLSDKDFRLLVRQFFQDEYPDDKRHLSKKVQWDEIKDWYYKLYEKGWVAPSWPSEFGGMGLSPSKLIIFNEESERYGVARTPGELGVLLLGPVLIKHGTKEQQQRYLPKVLNGEHVWCQGYSEPNAGSDLASLKTTAVLEGDEFVLNGQKTWTTRATESNWMFVLARTDKDAIKQKGISFFLLDLATPGITIRPIENLAGHPEFAEVFLDNVRIPKENLVGELNDGWTIAKSLLTFERLFSGSPQQSRLALFRLQTLADQRGLYADPVFASKLNEFRMDVLDLESLYSRFADQVRRGEALGPDIALLKIFGTATCQKISEYMVEVAEADAASLGAIEGTSVDVMSQYYYSRPITIFGGTSEIQRNILSKAVLELPSR